MAAKHKSIVLAVAAAGLAFLAMKPLVNPVPLVIWNASESVPIGWYLVSKRQPNIGEIAIIKPAEWVQIFEEALRYEHDYFYDPNMHGRDWKAVYKRYTPLVPYIKHRSDLTYVLDQVNGELSVGHSFVGGGDFPDIERSKVGLLGADITPNNSHWQIERIYTTENWNPGLTGPLDAPGLNIKKGYYIVGINGKEIKADENFYKYLDGTSGKQTILHVNDQAEFKGHWTEIVEPIRSENSLRQRTWVEDNRRLVDKLSNGRLGYIWVPNTGGPGFVSFNRYYFINRYWNFPRAFVLYCGLDYDTS